MGNIFSEVVTKEEDNHKFGGYKSLTNPRPGYHKTPTAVFYRGKEMKNSNVKSFVKMGNGWAKDNSSVYFKGTTVRGADSKTFKLESKFGKDKNNKYYNGKVV